MPIRNVQALIALGSLLGAIFISHIVVKIHEGKMPGGDILVLYLRIVLGFLFAAAITFGFYSFLP
jgi:hypothetical protein